MAYTTQARVELFLGASRVLVLGDRDNSGAIDTGLMDDAIARIGNRIDGALGTRYVVPFAAIADATPTPGSVSDLCDLGVAMLLYQWLAPKNADATMFKVAFEGVDGDAGQLGRYRDGTEIVVGGTRLDADASTNNRSVISESGGLHYSGRVDDDYSEDGVDRNTL